MFGNLTADEIWEVAGPLPPVRTRQRAYKDGASTLTSTAPR